MSDQNSQVELMMEEERISAAVDRFAEKMKMKLFEKAAQGLRGWNRPKE